MLRVREAERAGQRLTNLPTVTISAYERRPLISKGSADFETRVLHLQGFRSRHPRSTASEFRLRLHRPRQPDLQHQFPSPPRRSYHYVLATRTHILRHARRLKRAPSLKQLSRRARAGPRLPAPPRGGAVGGPRHARWRNRKVRARRSARARAGCGGTEG